MFRTHETVPNIEVTMSDDNVDKSATEKLTEPNSSTRPDDIACEKLEKEQVIKRIADIQDIINKLQWEVTDLTSRLEKKEKEGNKQPEPKVDSTMHFEHISHNRDRQVDIDDIINRQSKRLKVKNLNQPQYNRKDDSEES